MRFYPPHKSLSGWPGSILAKIGLEGNGLSYIFHFWVFWLRGVAIMYKMKLMFGRNNFQTCETVDFVDFELWKYHVIVQCGHSDVQITMALWHSNVVLDNSSTSLNIRSAKYQLYIVHYGHTPQSEHLKVNKSRCQFLKELGCCQFLQELNSCKNWV